LDEVKAKVLEKSLIGKYIGGYQILKLLDHGKSAAVFLALKEKNNYAVKVFDDELISKYGGVVQFERIKREIGLKEHPHKNLVNIIEGGICSITNNHYLVMEFIEGENLKTCLQEINQEDIFHYISQLATVAKHLDDLGYAHRDIKPENIMINLAEKKLTLMDLGVIKPIYGADLTDNDGIFHFIGTLQYSSPEYLLRNEEDSQEGWRALTFYQIGAVLHDMIMQVPIFKEECEPFSRLVIAVKDNNPVIKSDTVNQDLIHLAQCCLLKDPQKRLDMLNWNSFYQAEEPTRAKSRIMRKMQLATIELISTSTSTSSTDDEAAKNELKHRVIDFLKTTARLVISDNNLPLKPEVTSNNNDKVILKLNKSPKIGIKNEFHVIIQIEIVSTKIEALSIGYSTQNTEKATVNEGTIFKGIYSREKIYQGLEQSIFDSIDSILKDEDHE